MEFLLKTCRSALKPRSSHRAVFSFCLFASYMREIFSEAFFFPFFFPHSISQDVAAVNRFTFHLLQGPFLHVFCPSAIKPFIPDYLALSSYLEPKLR